MSDKEKKSSPKWLEKLKNIKHIEIYVAVIFIVILLLVYMSNFNSKDKTKLNNTNETTVTGYVDKLEQDLESILSNIAGVSDVKVMITLNTDQIEVIDSSINLSKFPEIKGILITAKGVNDVNKKLKVLLAVESVIDIKNGNIEILSSE